MADLDINNNFIRQINFFLTNKWVKLIIDGYINIKQKIKIKIPQDYQYYLFSL